MWYRKVNKYLPLQVRNFYKIYNTCCHFSIMDFLCKSVFQSIYWFSSSKNLREAPFSISPFLNHCSPVAASAVAWEMDCSETWNSWDLILALFPSKLWANSSTTVESYLSNLSRKGWNPDSYNKGILSLYLTVRSGSFTDHGPIWTCAITTQKLHWFPAIMKNSNPKK